MIQRTDSYYQLIAYIHNGQEDFYRFAYGHVKNREAALDIVQEAIVKALCGIHSLREPKFMKTWFYRILINESISYYRKNKRFILDDSIAELETIGEEADRAEILDLYRSIDRLDPKLKTIVMLRFFEDMSLQDIATVTGSNVNTVKTRLYRALDKLRGFISEV